MAHGEVEAAKAAGMRLDHALAVGEADARPGALGLGSEERVEDARLDLRRDARPPVRHHDLRPVSVPARLEPDLAAEGMTMVVVSGLVEDAAVVEIEATAVIPEEDR